MTLGSGIDVDIVTGFPKEKTGGARSAVIEKQLQEAKRRSMGVEADLRGEGGLVLENLIEVIAQHAERVLLQDTVYKLFVEFIGSLGKDINVVPMIMERHLKQVLPQYVAKPAPSGITGTK